MAKYGICLKCNEYGPIHVHHIDGHHDNDVPENRITLCPHCHHLAHVDLYIKNLGRPSSRKSGELLIKEMPKLPWSEVRRQYFKYFPRA